MKNIKRKIPLWIAIVCVLATLVSTAVLVTAINIVTVNIPLPYIEEHTFVPSVLSIDSVDYNYVPVFDVTIVVRSSDTLDIYSGTITVEIFATGSINIMTETSPFAIDPIIGQTTTITIPLTSWGIHSINDVVMARIQIT